MEDKRINEKLRLAIPWWLWGLWKHRNEFVFEKKQRDINVLIRVGMEEAEMWSHQQSQLALESKISSQGSNKINRIWTKPVNGMLKCNIHTS